MAVNKKSAQLIVSVLLLFSQVTHVLSVEGRLFFLAFMDPTPNTNPNSGIEEIHISGSENADSKVRVQVKSLNKTYMYMLNSTNNWSKTLTVFEDLAGPSGTKLPISVIVSSEKPISVQVNKAEDGTSGGYLALPITVESTEYYVASYTPRGPGQGFSIGSPDYTCVTVYKENGPEQIREMDISLDAGQVYHVQPGSDSTGWHVVSMKPIALFGGLDCAYIAKDTPSVAKCDHIIEQLHPKSEFGSIFVMSSFQGRKWTNGFQIRVVATFRTTVRWAEMEYDATSNTPKAPVVKSPEVVTRGNYLELMAGRGTSNPVVVMLTCDTPCEVMQYGESSDMPPAGNEPDGNKPDSTMITVPDLKHYTNDITFSTSKFYSVSGNQTLQNVNGITIVCKKSELSQIKFDGQTLPAGLSNAKMIDLTFPSSLSSPVATDNVIVPTDTYTVIYGGLINPGFHRVTSGSDAVRYMVYVYGHAPSSSPSDNAGYAYLGGFKYIGETNAPITEGPWFDFSAPVSETPAVTQPGSRPGQPGEPVQPTEYPTYETIWESHFYILNPHLEDLKTKICSEAYERYYKEERFAPMQKRVNEMVAQSCAPSTNVTMIHQLYFSQYTDGIIRFRLSVSAKGSVSLNEMFDCLSMVADYVGYIKNWVPVGYKDETSFLRPDADYNNFCDRLHMKTPRFESYYYGWNCPTRGGQTGEGAASGVKASFGLLASLALFAAVLLHQR